MVFFKVLCRVFYMKLFTDVKGYAMGCCIGYSSTFLISVMKSLTQ